MAAGRQPGGTTSSVSRSSGLAVRPMVACETCVYRAVVDRWIAALPVRGWVHRYNAEGLAGLTNRSSPGRRPRLTPEQKAELAAWVEAGPDPERDGVVRWRRVDLKRRIEAAFGVVMHERSVGKQLRALGLRRLVPRPKHPEADFDAQEAFKKTSRKP